MLAELCAADRKPDKVTLEVDFLKILKGFSRGGLFSLLISLIGLAITIYLTIYALGAAPLACVNSGVFNCGNVLNSRYKDTFGISNAELGLVFFLMEIVLLFIGNKDLLFLYNGFGVGWVFYFIYVEYMVGSICEYCTAVHIIIVALFIYSTLNLLKGGSPK